MRSSQRLLMFFTGFHGLQAPVASRPAPSVLERGNRIVACLILGVALAWCATPAKAGFIFAGETNGVDVVTHPSNYSGSGGTLNVSLGIDPASAFASQMEISIQNVVNTWNGLVPTTNNLVFGSANNIASDEIDFESTLLHEVGHALGLGHPNLASESGLTGSSQNYTKSTDGANNSYDLDPGADGIIGSGDDSRGDDVNLNYFNKSTNDPFDPSLPAVIDSTTYSRDISDLPSGDSFAANGDRDVANLLGYSNTESVMQQGVFLDEAQRTLAAEDIAHLRYGMSGVDELQGTSDDYGINLSFDGLTNTADIVIDFDNSQTSLAVTSVSGSFIGSSDHLGITDADIYFNNLSGQSYDWFFNDVSNSTSVVPEPSSMSLLGLGAISLVGYRWRRKRKTSKFPS